MQNNLCIEKITSNNIKKSTYVQQTKRSTHAQETYVPSKFLIAVANAFKCRKLIWLVGSSSINIVGCCKTRQHIDKRPFCPSDNVITFCFNISPKK